MVEKSTIFRRPAVERVAAGDAIPFYWDGTYHLFYLGTPPGTNHYPERVRCSWWHARSEDLAVWEELPVALSPSDNDGAPDRDGVWTGSVIHANGTFHIFYTGHSVSAEYPQTICHATGSDNIHYTKDRNNPILAPDTNRYEPVDWRDPYVFWHEAEGIYWMLLSARLKEGPPNLRGCIVLATSPDLVEWEVQDPIYAPYTTFCPECPELFQMGNTWYLIYSRFSESAQAVYRIGDSARGPWRTPLQESLDGRRWYAAKSLTDSNRRFSFGWVHDKEGLADDGTWEWGGDFCVPRELYQLEDNEIGVKCPHEITDLYADPYPFAFSPAMGKWEIEGNTVRGGAAGSLSYGFLDTPPAHYQLTCKIVPQDLQGDFGLLLKAADDLSTAHVLRFEPGTRCVSIVRWPEPLDAFWRDLTDRKVPLADPDGPRLVQRPISIEAGKPILCRVLMTDTIVEVFIDEQLSLTYRIYDPGEHDAGLFVQSGTVAFETVELCTV